MSEGGESMRRLVLVGVVALASAGGVRGQEPSTAQNPAYQRLDYFVGTWKGVGEQKPNSDGSGGGKFVGTMSCTKFAGGFHVVCSLEGTMGGKEFREMATFGYDAEEKAYTWYDIDNTGMNGLARGSLEKGTWTYVFESKSGGQPLRLKVALAEQGPTTFVNTAEVSVEGKPFELVVKATFNRTK
jgi:Protein of unknown function (DUF1579)